MATSAPAHTPPIASAADRPDWQTRAIEERYDLADRLNKLKRFLDVGGTAVDDDTRRLLTRQAKAMSRYLWCLDQRIKLFQK